MRVAAVPQLTLFALTDIAASSCYWQSFVEYSMRHRCMQKAPPRRTVRGCVSVFHALQCAAVILPSHAVVQVVGRAAQRRAARLVHPAGAMFER